MKYKFIAVLLNIIIITSILSGCSTVKQVNASQPINGEDLIKDYKEAEQVEELDQAFISGQNAFAYRLFSELKKEENVFISPYSISMALSMLYNGADNKTREEMAELLGYDQLEGYTGDYNATANHYMNANSQLLMNELQKADPKVELNIANSIWMSSKGGFQDSIESALLAPVRYYYNGDIFDVDFTLEKTLKDVNDWVADRTKGMIDPFLDTFNDPEMLRLFLVNAVYFNGKWSIPFEPKDTMPMIFYGTEAEKKVDMMYLHKKDFRYYSEGGIKGIELPYGNGRMVMNILIPEASMNTTIGKIYEEMTADGINLFINKLDHVATTKISTIALPKFELEYGLENLNDELTALGMEKAFNETEADFGLIGEDLYVSQVGHKAKIIVEEWGTKASAATGIEMETTSAEMDPLVFIANVPFLFLIRDKKTDTILFMGLLNQPK